MGMLRPISSWAWLAAAALIGCSAAGPADGDTSDSTSSGTGGGTTSSSGTGGNAHGGGPLGGGGPGGFGGHASGPLRAFPGAEGFAADAKGGRGGDVYHVTTLADGGPGSLREGIDSANGPRTIVFETGGEIRLESTLVIDKDYLTIVGQTAPGDGITIRDRSVDIRGARDIVIRFLRIRRGDLDVRASGKPSGSAGLDTVSIDDARNVILDHVSLSWSCDEIFGIVQNENVTIQWALIAEPLGDVDLHPYSDHHAYGLNTSANTLSLHHSLVANYVMRGPQLEANDASNNQGYHVLMEAVNNVLFDYERSGSRYTTGIESNPSAASDIDFRFHIRKNYYLHNPDESPRPEIRAEMKHGVSDQVKIHVAGNIGPNRPDDSGDEWAVVWTSTDSSDTMANAPSDVKAQRSDAPLFAPDVPVTEESAEQAYASVMAHAGFSTKRDAVDLRILQDVASRTWRDYVRSQDDVGGFPALQPGTPVTDLDRDGMSDAWELENGLDPSDPEDRNGDHDDDEYTNLEEYLEYAAWGA